MIVLGPLVAFESRMACRKEPAPLSLVFETAKTVTEALRDMAWPKATQKPMKLRICRAGLRRPPIINATIYLSVLGLNYRHTFVPKASIKSLARCSGCV